MELESGKMMWIGGHLEGRVGGEQELELGSEDGGGSGSDMGQEGRHLWLSERQVEGQHGGSKQWGRSGARSGQAQRWQV